jgi:hypothetical protein
MSDITIGKLVVTLAQTGRFNAEEIVKRVKQVFPYSQTTKKTVYSICSVAKVHLPGSHKSIVSAEGLKAVLAEIAPVAKTGTSGK